ncbi:MAG: DUF3617 domain-containing protein [Betaproteobacteria bacterium]|nr:DUF3617 domain-containing protein [Betaproteobacteria bacterium]
MQTVSGFSSKAIALLLLGYACAASAASVMEPGGWEIRTKITAQDLKKGETKTLNESTIKNCFSPEFLSKDPFLTPGIDQAKLAEKGATCSISDAKRQGNTASWSLDCAFPNGAKAKMSIKNTASKHEFVSDVTQQITKNGNTLPVHIVSTSKFIGACTADMKKF